MKEFNFALDMEKLIVPLLLPGYGEADSSGEPTSTPWPPTGASIRMQEALRHLLFIDLRTPKLRDQFFPALVNRIDSEVRKLRTRRRQNSRFAPPLL